MNYITIATGVVHEVPADLRKALMSDESALERWEDLTPLARNEWICWITSSKKPETRNNHIERVLTELLEGVRRPCCWLGCNHR
ncbi:MAG: YdeI/OmpD-associated family protein [Candidatus Saccharibacteria bacterium]